MNGVSMRFPYVAGTFYPGDRKELEEMIKSFFEKIKDDEILKIKKGINQVIGIVSPHAGYIYSGKTASYGYYFLDLLPPESTFVAFGPNHTGMGKIVSISREDWITPLGKVRNDTEVGEIIRKNSKFAEFDEEGHYFEHSIEVQLPLLQSVIKDPKCVEICIGMQTLEVVEDLANALKRIRKNFCIISSSDFTHFESSESARKNDEKAIEYILELDYERFIEFAEKSSICGYGPIGILMKYARDEKCKVKLLNYSNSGDATGDYSSVVGYASILFYK
jgi:AmmeMemoRadiSam system protein B